MVFYVVRHSERADEADKSAWVNYVTELQNLNRNRKFFGQDPPITDDKGRRYAQSAAQVLQSVLSRDGRPIMLFSSRMRRAVQTAAPIASTFNVPVHISSSLSQVIAYVHRTNGSFQFQSDEERIADCPGVSFVDFDAHHSGSNWITTIKDIVEEYGREYAVVIVSHRETIRDLAGRDLVTPYCCIALFDHLSSVPSSKPPTTVTNARAGSKPSVHTTLPIRATPSTVKAKSTKKLRGPAVFSLIRILNCNGEEVDQSVRK